MINILAGFGSDQMPYTGRSGSSRRAGARSRHAGAPDA